MVSYGECGHIETLGHWLLLCESVVECSERIKMVVRNILGKDVTDDQIISLSFNHRNIKILKVGLWFLIKILFSIYKSDSVKINDEWNKLIYDIEWIVKM